MGRPRTRPDAAQEPRAQLREAIRTGTISAPYDLRTGRAIDLLTAAECREIIKTLHYSEAIADAVRLRIADAEAKAQNGGVQAKMRSRSTNAPKPLSLSHYDTAVYVRQGCSQFKELVAEVKAFPISEGHAANAWYDPQTHGWYMPQACAHKLTMTPQYKRWDSRAEYQPCVGLTALDKPEKTPARPSLPRPAPSPVAATPPQEAMENIANYLNSRTADVSTYTEQDLPTSAPAKPMQLRPATTPQPKEVHQDMTEAQNEDIQTLPDGSTMTIPTVEELSKYTEKEISDLFEALDSLDPLPSLPSMPDTSNMTDDQRAVASAQYAQMATAVVTDQARQGKRKAYRAQRRRDAIAHVQALAEEAKRQAEAEDAQRETLAHTMAIHTTLKAWRDTAASLPIGPGMSIRTIDPVYSCPASLVNLWHGLAWQMHTTGKATNALFVGPKGTGKTKGAEEFSAYLGIRYLSVEMYLYRESRDLFLTREASPEKGTFYNKTSFTTAIEQGYCVIALEEITRASIDVQQALLSLLDHRRCAYVEGIGMVKVGPCVYFVASANEGTRYKVQPLELALESRFGIRYEVKPLATDTKADILKSRMFTRLTSAAPSNPVSFASWKPNGITPSEIDALCRVDSWIDQQVASGTNGQVAEPLGMRSLQDVADWYSLNGPDSLEYTLFSRYKDTAGRMERTAVRQSWSTEKGK